jgi:hypothetical protein
VVRLLPMSGHLALDGVAGAALALSPWLLGFADEVFWPHLLFGLFSVVASLVTRTHPQPSPGRESADSRQRVG